jgi:hypothetical protein
MSVRQFPIAPRAMLGALYQYLRCEHPIYLEKLEFYGVTSRVSRRVHEGERTIQILGVIAGGFRDKEWAAPASHLSLPVL